MKFFIASPWKNKAQVQELSHELADRGYEVYSFLENGANLSTGLSIEEEIKTFTEALTNWETDPNIKKIFDSEMTGLKSSDALILLGPVGHSSLIEAGIAYGIGKKIFIIGPVQRPEVFYLITGRPYEDVASFLKNLDSAVK